MKMAACQSLALEEPRAQGPPLQWALREKVVNHSCLPSLRTHSVLTRPVTEHFCLCCTALFGISKPSRFLQCSSMPLYPWRNWGESPGLPVSATWGVPAWWAVAWLYFRLRFVATWAESPLLSSTSAAGFPALILGSSATLRYPQSFCDLSVLQLHCPSEDSAPPLSLQSDVPHWSRLLKVLILCSAAVSLAGSWLKEALSPP